MGQGGPEREARGPEREGPAQSHTASQRRPGHTGGQNAALGGRIPQKGRAGPHGCCLRTCFPWGWGECVCAHTRSPTPEPRFPAQQFHRQLSTPHSTLSPGPRPTQRGPSTPLFPSHLKEQTHFSAGHTSRPAAIHGGSGGMEKRRQRQAGDLGWKVAAREPPPGSERG